MDSCYLQEQYEPLYTSLLRRKAAEMRSLGAFRRLRKSPHRLVVQRKPGR